MNACFWQYLLPHHLISRLAGKLANCETPWFKDYAINRFLKDYPVDLSEAQISDPKAFKSFNDFFTRALKPELREIDKQANTIISPVDGQLSAFGKVENHQLFQAKNHYYSLEALLGYKDDELINVLNNGPYATIYLAPHDYHRIHMPLSGTLQSMRYVPGRLFSVNLKTADNIPGLFARNERVILQFNTEHGPLILVLVGAMIVASISTVFSGLVAPNKGQIMHRTYSQTPEHHIYLEKGDEVARFHLGSTVIAILGNKDIQWDDNLESGQLVKLGNKMADC